MESTYTTPELTMAYVLERIDIVLHDTKHLHEALAAVNNMAPLEPSMLTADTRGQAITAIVQSREATNQQLLRMLEKMYDDLKPPKEDDEIARFRMLGQTLSSLAPDTASRILGRIAQQMYVKAGAEIVPE